MKVLIIEDDQGIAELVREQIEKQGHNVVIVQTPCEAIEYIETEIPDLMILDYGLPEMNGIELINNIKEKLGEVPPFIVSTGQGNEQLAVNMMKLGAQDYVIKDIHFLELLPERVKRVIREIRNRNKRKRAEKALKESEENYRTLFNSIRDAILVADTNRKIIRCNQAFSYLFGYEIEEIKGKETLMIYENKDDFKNVGNRIKGNIDKEFFLQDTLYRKKDGTTFSGETSIFYLKGSNGKINGFIGLIRDITEKKRIEKKLHTTQMHYTDFINSSSDAVSYWKAPENLWINLPVKKQVEMIYESECVDTNKVNWELYGYKTKHEIIGKKYKELANKKVIDPVLIEFVSNSYQHKNILVYQVLKNNKSRYSLENWYGVIEEDKLTYIWAGSKDITEQKIAEEELIKTNKELNQAKEKAEESDRLKSAFLANMSHEIRTPMNGIVGFAGMLMEKGISDDKRNYYAQVVIDSSQQLLNIVDDILDLSRIETGNVELIKEETPVNDIIMDLYAFFRLQFNNKAVSLLQNKGLSDIESIIWADKLRLKQILTNLLSNAFKFTSKGFIKVGYKLKTDYLEFFVQDTGVGIGHDHLEKIFERFRQEEIDITKNYGGTGLGLSISQKLVKLFGGEIWVESEKNKGSVFYFTIPYNPVNKEEILKNKTKNSEKDFFTILVAEDEEINFLYIEEVIKAPDIKVLHARNGKQAVEACKQNLLINLVLMDLKMPVLDGYNATKQIKEFRPDLPVIAQTAYAMQGDKLKAEKAGCDEYMSKPLKSSELLQLVEKYKKV